MTNPWKKQGDLLDFEAIGHSFTNLIKSLDAARVVSIEAGFGRGKTFFRKAWSEHLRQAGEVVVEIDVQQSDHSGDPVITFLGALAEHLPKAEKGKAKQAFESAKKLGAVGARAVAKMALKSGADEIFEFVADTAVDQLEDFDALDGLINDLGDGLSKAAGQLIASQMAAEKVRKEELPEQLKALRQALTQGKNTKRVTIIIDELDRCHPDYAISVLEAMKLVFCQSGFIFCLMVNADYLERLAQHRFGTSDGDEKYLDKFVDIRLRLEPKRANREAAIKQKTQELPLKIPYGDNAEFSMERASDLASSIVDQYDVSMRKAENTLYKVELALRCYQDQPLDPSLLVFLAFQDALGIELSTKLLPRAMLTPEEGERVTAEAKALREKSYSARSESDFDMRMNDRIMERAPELTQLPRERYQLAWNQNFLPWALAYKILAPMYLPFHKEVLNAVAEFQVEDNRKGDI